MRRLPSPLGQPRRASTSSRARPRRCSSRPDDRVFLYYSDAADADAGTYWLMQRVLGPSAQSPGEPTLVMQHGLETSVYTGADSWTLAVSTPYTHEWLASTDKGQTLDLEAFVPGHRPFLRVRVQGATSALRAGGARCGSPSAEPTSLLWVACQPA